MGSKEPTPGGGAAAAIAGATGAALIAMVGRLTVGKPGSEDIDERMRALVERADGAREEFLTLGDRDAEAFEVVMAAFRLPKGPTSRRPLVPTRSSGDSSGRGGAARDRAAGGRSDGAGRRRDRHGESNAASDGMTAAGMLLAAVIGARANVEINASSLKDEARRHALIEECDAIRERADALLEQCREAFGLRLTG